MITVQKAEITDIPILVDVITRSIKSCVQDHHNNVHNIAEWLANKDEKNLTVWMQNNLTYKAIVNQYIVGIIMCSPAGEILLNYVLPSSQQLGVGKAMLDTVKTEAKQRQLSELYLDSTLTAKAFYLSQGFSLQVGNNASTHDDIKMVYIV